MQPTQERPTHLRPRTSELHRTRPSNDVRKFAKEQRKTKWLKWQVEVLSEACSKRYCSSGEELKTLETVRNAFAQALNKRLYGDGEGEGSNYFKAADSEGEH